LYDFEWSHPYIFQKYRILSLSLTLSLCFSCLAMAVTSYTEKEKFNTSYRRSTLGTLQPRNDDAPTPCLRRLTGVVNVFLSLPVPSPLLTEPNRESPISNYQARLLL
jgi:hypothetical protein